MARGRSSGGGGRSRSSVTPRSAPSGGSRSMSNHGRAPAAAPATSPVRPAHTAPTPYNRQTQPQTQQQPQRTNEQSRHVPQQQHQQQHPQQHHPQQQSMQQPAMQQQSRPGLMGSIGSGIMNGLTFGIGSSLSHRVMDGLLGPRTVQHEFAEQEQQPLQQEQQQQQQQQGGPIDYNQQYNNHQMNQMSNPNAQHYQSQPTNAPCTSENSMFERCMQQYQSQAQCGQYQLDLTQCLNANRGGH